MSDHAKDAEITCKSCIITGYVLAVPIGRMIVFDALPKVPKECWENVYWFVAGAAFALLMGRILKSWEDV